MELIDFGPIANDNNFVDEFDFGLDSTKSVAEYFLGYKLEEALRMMRDEDEE